MDTILLTEKDYKIISKRLSEELDKVIDNIDTDRDEPIYHENYMVEIDLSEDRAINIEADFEIHYIDTPNDLDYLDGTGYSGDIEPYFWDVTPQYAELYDISFDDWIPVDVEREKLLIL